MKPMSIKIIAKAIGAEYSGRDAMVSAITTDSRDVPENSLFIALKGDNFDGHRFIDRALVIGASFAVSMEDKGFWPDENVLVVNNTRHALMNIANLYRRSIDLRVVGITGSVGKTTTKEMVACVAAAGMPTLKTPANLNNEVGLSKSILRLEEHHRAAVLEMGIDGPGQMKYLSKCAEPDVAIVTNIGVSHIQNLGSRQGIRDEKLAIRGGMPDGGTLILCGDDDMLQGVEDSRLNIVKYAIDARAADARAENLREYSTHTDFDIVYNEQRFAASIPAPGKHNVYNTLAAFLAGITLGIQPETCVAALQEFQTEGMRQKVVHHAGFTVVEDCYNASPDSMRAALSTLGRLECGGKRIAVLSDMKELGDEEQRYHREVGGYAAGSGVDLLLCTGGLSAETVRGAEEAGLQNAHHYPDMDALYGALAFHIERGDIIWFKASRAMRLEQVIKKIYKNF